MGKLRIGRGDFTMLKYIENLSAADLEKVVGFHKGRLDSGFSIIALDDDEIMRPEDFELKLRHAGQRETWQLRAAITSGMYYSAEDKIQKN